MFSKSNKRKAILTSKKVDTEQPNRQSIPSLVEPIESRDPMEDMDSTGTTPTSSISSMSPSPTNVAKSKRFKWFGDDSSVDSMDTTPSAIELVKYTNHDFDDFKKPFDCFAPSCDQGSVSNRSSMSSLLSVSSLTGRSSYSPNKKGSLDKMDGLDSGRRGSSLDISSQGVKNFISGMVTPNFKRKSSHSTSSDSLRSESIENVNASNNDSVFGGERRNSSFTKAIQNMFMRDRSASSSKEDISPPGRIFGKQLADVPTYLDGKMFGSQTGYGYNGAGGSSHGMMRSASSLTENGIPEVLVRCIKRINKEKTTLGLYRTNGENKAVKQMRCDIDMGNYDEVEKCTNIATVTSSLKLFLREMPQPLITKEIQNLISDSQIDWSAINDKLLISQLESIFMRIDHLSFCVLKYFLKHLKDVSETEGNKMDAYNLAIVMAPVLLHTNDMAGRRFSLMVHEMERNVRLIEKLITYEHEIFETS